MSIFPHPHSDVSLVFVLSGWYPLYYLVLASVFVSSHCYPHFPVSSYFSSYTFYPYVCFHPFCLLCLASYVLGRLIFSFSWCPYALICVFIPRSFVEYYIHTALLRIWHGFRPCLCPIFVRLLQAMILCWLIIFTLYAVVLNIHYLPAIALPLFSFVSPAVQFIHRTPPLVSVILRSSCRQSLVVLCHSAPFADLFFVHSLSVAFRHWFIRVCFMAFLLLLVAYLPSFMLHFLSLWLLFLSFPKVVSWSPPHSFWLTLLFL